MNTNFHCLASAARSQQGGLHDEINHRGIWRNDPCIHLKPYRDRYLRRDPELCNIILKEGWQMKNIMEEYGPVFITIAVSVVLIGVAVSFFRDGGLLNQMVGSYLSSICG